ncbi:MAG: hypothetical protein HYR56_22160 [Acidobacteria bacterium]|nr:hypothetical protein [Acidobacteriota bacterium]MBI3423207.1 hypothetical protein [Acidobacteriota bacterium]
MSKMKLILSFIGICLVLTLAAQAQTQSPATSPVAATPDVQLLRAILEELRLQRTVLQRTYVNAYRAQTLTERLARQQARVDSLGEEIAQLKSVIQHAQDTRDEDELKDLLATINETADPQQRAALAQSYNSLKRALERQREYARQEADRSRERQQQLEVAWRTEQAKLAELQEQFDTLERELELVAAESKPRK